MPVLFEDFKSAQKTSLIQVALEPVHTALHSLLLVAMSSEMSGLSAWVQRTVRSLSRAERQRSRLVMLGFYHAVMPEESWPDFPAYLEHLASLEPDTLVEKIFDAYELLPCKVSPPPAPEELPSRRAALASLETYLHFLRLRFGPDGFDPDLETEAFGLFQEPARMQALIISHLEKMWAQYLQAEWQRVQPILRASVEAFQRQDFGGMDPLEAARAITGQEFDTEKWTNKLKDASSLIFVPNLHAGPYLWAYRAGGTIWLFFGARMPAGTQAQSPELTRAEIQVRVEALADESRLQIIQLISERGELRSQEVIDALDMSQSAASRHLKQLTATGYLRERRCDGAKCFSLNRERIEQTLSALRYFLLDE